MIDIVVSFLLLSNRPPVMKRADIVLETKTTMHFPFDAGGCDNGVLRRRNIISSHSLSSAKKKIRRGWFIIGCAGQLLNPKATWFMTAKQTSIAKLNFPRARGSLHFQDH